MTNRNNNEKLKKRAAVSVGVSGILSVLCGTVIIILYVFFLPSQETADLVFAIVMLVLGVVLLSVIPAILIFHDRTDHSAKRKPE